ncbi:MAG: carbohydrate kinase [Erysipelotrichaceae bacterium]|nr:carbohydrate kinase [Erysipelotrichaceae bacterium]
MKKLIAIGEALIDFIPQPDGSYMPHLGGAPCNVAGAYVKLGGKATLLSQLGDDLFGHRIMNELKETGIDTHAIPLALDAKTSLAFVGLSNDGQRTFSFYRNPGADMLYHPDNITDELFKDAYGLHFCSVSLVDSPMKQAHKKAIEMTLKNHQIISFDPNVRLMLWNDHDLLKKTIWEFIPFAHVLKVSDEEIEFLCDTANPSLAAEKLMIGNVELVMITCGAEGIYAYTKKFSTYVPSYKAKALDTTGAGDGFIGSFLYQCAQKNIQDFGALSIDELNPMLRKSAVFSGKSVEHYGAISSYPESLCEENE